MRIKAIVKLSVGVLLLFLSVACATAPDLVTGKRTSNLYSLNDEAKIGTSVLNYQKKLFERDDISVDSPKNKKDLERLQKIMGRIAAVSHYPDFPYEVHLADAEIVNAWCAPGGKIMFYTGLWDSEKGLVEHDSDDQIAAVMAHEIAHANARHQTEAITRNYTRGMIFSTLGAVVAQTDFSWLGDAFQVADSFIVPSYSRRDEREADKIGLNYMARAGYDPREAVKLWQKAAQRKGSRDKTSLFASHPASGERAKNLEAMLPETLPLYDEAKAKHDAESRKKSVKRSK